MVQPPDSGMLGRLAYFLFYALRNRKAYWNALSQEQTAVLQKKPKCTARDLVLKLDQALRTYEKWGCLEFSNLRYIDLDLIECYETLVFTILKHDSFLFGFDPDSNRPLSLYLKEIEEPFRPLQYASVSSVTVFPVISRIGVTKRAVEKEETASVLADNEHLILTFRQVDTVLNSIRVVDDIVNFEHLFLEGYYPSCRFCFPYSITGKFTDIQQYSDNISYGLVTICDSQETERTVVINLQQLMNQFNGPIPFRKLKIWITDKEPNFLLLCIDEYPYGHAQSRVAIIEGLENDHLIQPSKRRSALKRKFGKLTPFDSYFS
jgi:hypothetical protein